jgi:hypothetical protein
MNPVSDGIFASENSSDAQSLSLSDRGLANGEYGEARAYTRSGARILGHLIRQDT